MARATGDRDDLDGLGEEYEILGELGRGGVSVVYRARDRYLGRDVAIKVVREPGNAEATARFAREARTLARLNHPNVVNVYAARRLANGGFAIVMQYARGRTLREAIRCEGPFPAERAESVLRDLATALDYLAAAQVIHRDIKPENIFLEDQSGTALLSDFGIAKAENSQTDITLTGMVIGTPAYMSPEQIDGCHLDVRSDLYSLGLVGFEMLTGRKPWDGENLYSIIYKQKHESLPPLSTVRPDVPARLRRAIEGALVKDRALRCGSAAEFLIQLGHSPSLSGPGPLDTVAAPAAETADPALEETATRSYPLEAAATPRDPRTRTEPRPPALAGHRRPKALWIVPITLVVGGAALFATMGPGSPSSDLQATAPRLTERLGPGATSPSEPRSAGGAAPGETSALPGAVPDYSNSEPLSAGELDARSLFAGDTSGAGTGRGTASPPRGQGARVPRRPREVVVPDAPPWADGIAAIQRSAATPPPAIPLLDATIPPPPGDNGRSGSAGAFTSPQLRNETEVTAALAAAYPAVLRANGIGGVVVVALLVDATGRVILSEVRGSSGNALLDAAALRVSETMRFHPAQNRGRPIAAQVTLPIVFQGPR